MPWIYLTPASLSIKQRAIVCIFGKLGVGSTKNWCSFVWWNLTFMGGRMFVFEKQGTDAFINGEVMHALWVVSGEIYASILVSLPVFGDLAVLFENSLQALGILVAKIFDANFLDNESEYDRLPCVILEARGCIQL
jgi:hypothetical protein